MKPVLLALLLATLSLPAARAVDLTTTEGATFKDVLVVSVAFQKVLIWHAGGQEILPVDKLPEDLRKQYCDPSLFSLPDPLTLTDGTVLKKPQVTAIDQEGISISHAEASGSTRYTFEVLPPEIRSHYPFTDASRTTFRTLYAQRVGPVPGAGSGALASHEGEGYYLQDGTYVPARTVPLKTNYQAPNSGQQATNGRFNRGQTGTTNGGNPTGGNTGGRFNRGQTGTDGGNTAGGNTGGRFNRGQTGADNGNAGGNPGGTTGGRFTRGQGGTDGGNTSGRATRRQERGNRGGGN